MGNENDRFARLAEAINALLALALKRLVAHRQYFVGDQDVGINRGRHGKRQARVHA